MTTNENSKNRSLNRVTPTKKANNLPEEIIPINQFRWKSHCKWLFQLPIAA